jgi:hypothetical protein
VWLERSVRRHDDSNVGGTQTTGIHRFYCFVVPSVEAVVPLVDGEAWCVSCGARARASMPAISNGLRQCHISVRIASHEG